VFFLPIVDHVGDFQPSLNVLSVVDSSVDE